MYPSLLWILPDTKNSCPHFKSANESGESMKFVVYTSERIGGIETNNKNTITVGIYFFI
ncbi:MAG: hypothetical protein AMQ74_01942 [Candidatus Methanofastidiosum methylothiophilum]|uniref:Uncharacterized protein n=1 Tax=Candidatus Methanofastidiosum methylothiophilum TaxID=1705564 RepID=A0A150IIJ9_9EURY|nr:MAG: hypothetical protein AMQ74_01942 [Candidatus Methanofastidiosum methylthiophilus]